MLYTSSLYYAQKLKKIIKEYETYLSHKVNIKNMCTIRRKRGKKRFDRVTFDPGTFAKLNLIYKAISLWRSNH